MCCMTSFLEKLRNYPKNYEGAAYYTISYNLKKSLVTHCKNIIII